MRTKIVKIPKWRKCMENREIFFLWISLYFSKVWIVITCTFWKAVFFGYEIGMRRLMSEKKVVLGISWSARWSHSIAQIGSQHSWVLALESLWLKRPSLPKLKHISLTVGFRVKLQAHEGAFSACSQSYVSWVSTMWGYFRNVLVLILLSSLAEIGFLAGKSPIFDYMYTIS